MNKICIIAYYFGSLPPWFDFVLKSWLNNSTITFYFFTDSFQQKGLPNINVIPFSLEMFKDLFNKKIGHKLEIKNPRKICDFTPLFGKVFEDYLNDYSFWGRTDIDLIFGNIRSILTEELLDNYDLISTRKEYFSGHFSLYRNNNTINNLYKRSPDHLKVINKERYYNFDECGHLVHYILIKGKKFDELNPVVFSFNHIIHNSKDIRTHFNTIVSEKFDLENRKSIYFSTWRIEYHQDRLIAETKEVLYFHFNAYKWSPRFFIPRWKYIPYSYLITKNGFKRPDQNKVQLIVNRCVYFIKFVFSKKYIVQKPRRRLFFVKYYLKKVLSLFR